MEYSKKCSSVYATRLATPLPLETTPLPFLQVPAEQRQEHPLRGAEYAVEDGVAGPQRGAEAPGHRAGLPQGPRRLHQAQGHGAMLRAHKLR